MDSPRPTPASPQGRAAHPRAWNGTQRLTMRSGATGPEASGAPVGRIDFQREPSPIKLQPAFLYPTPETKPPCRGPPPGGPVPTPEGGQSPPPLPAR